MKPRAVALLILLAVACACRKSAPAASHPFDEKKFIIWALHTSMSYSDLGALAARRGYGAETRALGQQMVQEQTSLHADLARAAQKSGLAVPSEVEERRRALKENLLTLPGQVFDRGFTLALAQDSSLMLRGFDQSGSTNNAVLKEVAGRYRSVIEQEQKTSNQILARIGGSPFGYSPETGAPAPF
jgi:predicted outer membrane protein